MKLSFFIFGLMFFSCVTSKDETVKLSDTPSQDKPYAQVLNKSTRSADVINDFETRYKINVTQLSPEFRVAFAERLKRVYLQDNSSFDEASSKMGFFVSIFSPESYAVDLGNQNHWNILLKLKDDRVLKPIAIKKLSDKLRWQSFFDFVARWTTEYLIVFEAPSMNPNAPELVDKVSINLTFANTDAQTTLTW